MAKQINQFTVTFYAKQDGSIPLRDFILGMNAQLHARTLRMIELLRERGNELREPYTKPLADGIFELRIQNGNDAARICYFFMIGRNIIMTNGFMKKTQKTPQSEIEKAKLYRTDYLARLNQNGGNNGL
ncbi:MAG: type II toxin-antitoxin system RelE/ParE family toxin [Proteobacteria bacterium]|nr:type II toxin-antitoxin system RelE/ParE family toxin [Pseudomonadota bacterium]